MQEVESREHCDKTEACLSLVEKLKFPCRDVENLDKLHVPLSKCEKELLNDYRYANETLKIAVLLREINVIKYLARIGVKVGYVKNIGFTALQLANKNELRKFADELLKIYQDENSHEINEPSYLHSECNMNDTLSAVIMIGQGGNLDIACYDGKSSLRTLEFLLKYKYEANSWDSNGRTILHRFCYDVYEHCSAFDNTYRLLAIDLLIKYGAGLNQRDFHGNTPILGLFDPCAAVRNVNKQDVRKHKIIRNCQRDRLKILVDAGAKLDVSSYFRGDETLLHLIVLSKARDVDSFSMTPTELEVIFNDEIGAEMLEMLLVKENGEVDVDAKNKRNRSALQEAVSYLNYDAVKVLLRHEADTSQITFEGGYFEKGMPLMSSQLVRNLLGIVELLKEHDYEMKIADYELIYKTMLRSADVKRRK